MHPNAQVVMSGFKAFAEGDEAGMKAMMADDAVWHSGGNHKWSGDHVGKDAIMRLMSGVRSEAELINEPHAVLADDEHVVTLVHSRATRGEKTYSGQTVLVFHVDGDVVTEAWTFPYDAEALNAFWGN